MNLQMEDRIGKLSMIVVFSIIIYRDIFNFGAIIVHRNAIDLWELIIISKIFAIIFVASVVYFTVLRHNPVSSAPGLLPRLTSIFGTFVMMSMIALPSQEVARPLQIASAMMIIVGTILSIMCLRRLGRSFSIMASARELVTTGPYSIVRHPLYCAELITIIGVVMAHGSFLAVVVGAIWLLLQYQRARFEEGVLREAFPAYEDYARQVPMMVPNLAQLVQQVFSKKDAAKQTS
jgi:protein-S-isoprenylcysteine O-methyltransferase Ste14